MHHSQQQACGPHVCAAVITVLSDDDEDADVIHIVDHEQEGEQDAAGVT